MPPRLRRAMSFTSGKSSDRGRKRSESNSKSFLDSMKSLYATISKRAASPSKAWLPDDDSQIFRSYVFGPSGFRTMAPLCSAAKFRSHNIREA